MPPAHATNEPFVGPCEVCSRTIYSAEDRYLKLNGRVFCESCLRDAAVDESTLASLLADGQEPGPETP